MNNEVKVELDDAGSVVKKVKVDGFCYYTVDRLADVFEDAQYEPLTTKIIKNFLSEGDTFVDVGAHHGYYTLIAARLVGPKGKVISFEPVPQNRKVLKKNIESNHLVNVVTNHFAIGNKDQKTRKFFLPLALDNASFGLHPRAEASKTKQIFVECKTLDSCLMTEGKARVDLLKIDTEGYELEVIEGAERVIRSNKNIKMILEFNPKCLKVAGHDPNKVLERLIILGFDLFFIGDASWQIYKYDKGKGYDQLVPNNGYINILALPKGQWTSIVIASHSGGLKGGAERSLLEISKYLVKSYCIVNVVTTDTGELYEKLKNTGIGVAVIPFYWWAYTKSLRLRQKPPPKDIYLKSLGELIDLLEILNPDVVATNTSVIPYGGLAAKYLGLPHIWFVREFGNADHQYYYWFKYEQVLSLIDALSDRVVANSVEIKKHLTKVIPAEKVTIIYPFCRVRQEIVASLKEKIYNLEGDITLIIAGAIFSNKGQDDAIEAVRILKEKGFNVNLIIAGVTRDKSYFNKLNKKVLENRLAQNVLFSGYVADPYPLMALSDVILVCSKREAFGRTAVEGMLLGKPVISTSAGGVLEIVQEGVNGFTYQYGHPEELAEKIQHFLKNRKLLNVMGRNAYRIATEKFSEKQCLVPVVRMIKQVIGKSGRNKDKDTVLALTQLIGIAAKRQNIFIAEENRLNSQLALNEQLNHKLQEKLQEISTLYVNTNNHLNSILHSRAWRLVQLLRKVVNFLKV